MTVPLDQEWETTTGLPLDGANVTITAAEFGYNADIGAGVVCMNMTFVDDDTEAEVEQSFSVGKTGEPNRDGSELTGAPAKFSGRSNYGRLIDSVRSLVDHPGEVIGSPKKAEGWVGTKWTVGTTPVETTNPNKPDEKKVKDALVFVAYHGKADGKPAKAKAGATSKRAAKPAPVADDDDDETDEAAADPAVGTSEVRGDAVDADSGNTLGIDAALWKRLVKMAKASDTHDEFSDLALELDEVDADKKVQKAVLSTKAGSVWHAVNGDG
jgi:hypothetical protein